MYGKHGQVQLNFELRRKKSWQTVNILHRSFAHWLWNEFSWELCFVDADTVLCLNTALHSVERQFEVRDLALARLEGEKERGGEVQVRNFGDECSLTINNK